MASILDFVHADLGRISTKLSPEDRALLDEHMQQVRQLEQDIAAAENQKELIHPEPEIDPGLRIFDVRGTQEPGE